jgi:histidine phosphotransferase ChpT
VDEAALTPRAAAAYLAHRLAKEQGGSVQVSTPDDGVLLLGATVPR